MVENPHQPSSQPKQISRGFPGHGVFPGILLLQGGGGRGEKDFKGLERWDEHPAAEWPGHDGLGGGEG